MRGDIYGQGVIAGLWHWIKRVLSSSELALFLLVAIMISCLVGVTMLSYEKAMNHIFSSAWFNALLIMLVVNVAFRFIGRMWGKKLTIVSAGMLLFHLSFVAIFLGVVYNSLFGFHGKLRLTEGEVLKNSDPASFDLISSGRYYELADFKGETMLLRLQKNYVLDGQNKGFVYEVAVGEGDNITQDTIYITKNMVHDGYKFFRDKEGYSILVMLYDKDGTEIYGGFIPLQSLRQEDGSFMYTTGSKEGPGSFPFPAAPAEPVFFLQAAFAPSQFEERRGDVAFEVWPYSPDVMPHDQEPLANGAVTFGEKFNAGDYSLALEEVRYWVSMDVRYDPGYPIILSSLWVGLAGMVLVFIGRLRARSARKVSEAAGA